MKRLGDLLSSSAAPYRKALLKKQSLIEAIVMVTGVTLPARAVSFSRRGVRIEASATRRSIIFEHTKEIIAEFERRAGEHLGRLY